MGTRGRRGKGRASGDGEKTLRPQSSVALVSPESRLPSSSRGKNGSELVWGKEQEAEPMPWLGWVRKRIRRGARGEPIEISRDQITPRFLLAPHTIKKEAQKWWGVLDSGNSNQIFKPRDADDHVTGETLNNVQYILVRSLLLGIIR